MVLWVKIGGGVISYWILENVLILWQLEHTTSHLSSSSRIEHIECAPQELRMNFFSPRT